MASGSSHSLSRGTFPAPETHPSNYTRERVEHALLATETRLNSYSKTAKPAPTLEKLLIFYRSACQDFLHEDANSAASKQLIGQIQAFEHDLSDSSWAGVAVDEKTQELQDEMIKLRQSYYFSQYGDYFARMAHLLQGTRECLTEGWQEVSETYKWNDIAASLRSEEKDWKRYGTSNGIEPVKISFAVWEGCRKIGVDFHTMKAAIISYGERNETVHSRATTLVEEAKFASLAKLIHQDIQDLPKVMPADMADHETYTLAILTECRDHWFIIKTESWDHSANPGGGIYKTALFEAREKVKAALPEVRLEARRRHEVEVARGALARLREEQEEHILDERSREEAWKLIYEQRKETDGELHITLSRQRQVNRLVSFYREQWSSFH